MYAKLIDGALQYAPKKIKDGDSTTYNPQPEMLIAHGYLPVIETDRPEVEDGYYAEAHYTEEAGQIIQTWTVEIDPYWGEASPEDIAKAIKGVL